MRMFIGHYAPALAFKAVRNSPNLGVGFLAVQLVDVGFFSLSYLGVEKWAPNEALQGFQKIDLYFMPYTHSLLGAACWAAAAGLVIAAFATRGAKLVAGMITAILVLSHWFLDLIVHRHDLAIASDADQKLGFGLWNYPLIEAPLEIALLLAGFAIYLAVTTPRGVMGRIVPWFLLAALIAVQCFNWFTARPADVPTMATMGLGAYFAIALLGLWMDSLRAPREAGAGQGVTAAA
jgi:hypothetical protein